MGNISILIFSFIFIITIIIYLHKKWPDLDIIDVCIVFVLLHFGLNPFIRGLYFGKDIAFDFRNSHPLPIGLVFAQILIIILIIRLVVSYTFARYLKYINIRYIIEQCGHINKYFLFLVYAGLVAFPVISYYVYGVRTYIQQEDFEKIGKYLPYWFSSVRTIYNYIAFCIFLGLFANIVKGKKGQQFLWIILTVIFILTITIFGRRYFLNIIVLGIIFWFVYKQEDIFRWKYLAIGLFSVGAFFLFSNIYQSYREVLFSVGEVNSKKIENPISAAFNFNSTIENLKIRAGTWEFNYLVISNQIDKSGMTTNGRITWEGFKSSIPKIFWPGKQFSLIDDILSEFYKIDKRDINIAKNIFGIAQLEFSYYSIVIVPIIVILITAVLAGLIAITSKYPTFMVMFVGNVMWYLINYEENGNEIFYMLRNTVIIGLLLIIYTMIVKLYTIYYNKKIDNL
jgi:hypothetical protein